MQSEQQKGYDFFGMQDWLERHKLVSMDAYIIEQNLQNPAYVNSLGLFQPKPGFAQQAYGYYDPQAQMAPSGMPPSGMPIRRF